MLTSIHIQNLRGIADGSLTGLTKINVIVGPNNAGKSTLLDAILLGASPQENLAYTEVIQRRTVKEPNKWLLRKANRGTEGNASIEVITDGGRKREVLIISNGKDKLYIGAKSANPHAGSPKIMIDKTALYNFQPLPGIPEIRLIDQLTDRTKLYDLYTRVVESGLRKEAKEIIRAVIPELEDIEILTTQNQPVLYLVFSEYAHPVELAGDGIVLLLKLVFELAVCSGGIALLEEPETHMHPAAIRQCVKALWAAANRGIQICLTTHSLDLIDSLLTTDESADLEEISIFRVQLTHGILKTHRLSGKEAQLARTQIEDDLR